jgi:hypothetical protein
MAEGGRFTGTDGLQKLPESCGEGVTGELGFAEFPGIGSHFPAGIRVASHGFEGVGEGGGIAGRDD